MHPSYPAFNLVSGISDPNIKDIAISPFYPNIIYLSSSSSLYKSENGGKTFQKTETFVGGRIRQLFCDPRVAGLLYVVGAEHFYQIAGGKEKLFTVDDEEEILSGAEANGYLYLGTTNSLYFSGQDFISWKKIKGLGDAKIYWIEPGQKNIYLATSDGVYLLEQNQRLKRTFVIRGAEKNQAGEGNIGFKPNKIKPDIFNPERVWLATTRGLFLSENKGKDFKRFFVAGIDYLNIFSLAQTSLEKDSLYLATDKGLFKIDLKKKKAKAIFEGLSTPKINQIKFTEEGKIYLATGKGAFTNQYFTLSSKDNSLEAILAKEPSIGFVHSKTMCFNEVSPEKITKWRQAAALRPLFPEVTLNYDKTIYGTAGGATYEGKAFVGPRDWGVSFSWDIGDFIWNPSQTSIDTRSRLNTKLRIDILEEVNRVYFERLRLKKELNGTAVSEEEKFKRKLRLKELTAMLDYYTGGAFSERLRELNGG